MVRQRIAYPYRYLRGRLRHVKKVSQIAFESISGRIRRSDVAIFFNFQRPPWGGGNQFLLGLRKEMASRNIRVQNNFMGSSTKACLFNSHNFDFERLKRMRHKRCRTVHRVDGPVSIYRGEDDGTDSRILDFNRQFADATVFQSNYSMLKHQELGMGFVSPQVILNGVDPEIFNSGGRINFDRSRKIRLISTSWSDNTNKGFSVYSELEDMLDWDKFEYTFVGQSPIKFKRVRHIKPLPSMELADVLRQHDIFITASLHESCSNALLEALACGLPAMFVNSGSLPEIAGEAGFSFNDGYEIPDLLNRLVEEYEHRQRLISIPSIAEVTDQYLQVLGIEGG